MFHFFVYKPNFYRSKIEKKTGPNKTGPEKSIGIEWRIALTVLEKKQGNVLYNRTELKLFHNLIII